jgi:predicted ester cyclase
MPDHNKSIDDMVAEGDKVVIRYTVQGTQKGAILGIPATGKHVSITACDIYKIEGGKKILEWWEFPDYLGGIIKAGVIFSAPPKT